MSNTSRRALGNSPQLWVWEWAFGTNFEQALAQGGRVGQSLPLAVVAGGQVGPPGTYDPMTLPSAPTLAPGLLVGLQPFALTQSTAPPPPSLPVILRQPQSLTVRAGATVTFTVGVSGTGPFTFQWRWDGHVLAEATNPVLTLQRVTTNQAGAYSVVVANQAGSVTSTEAILTVVPPPVPAPPTIARQPQSLTVVAGSNATFSVVASGSLPLFYQWWFNGATVPHATAPQLTLYRVRPEQAGGYFVVVSNSLGSVTSDTATLTVTAAPPPPPPVLVEQPKSLTVLTGALAFFHVTALGEAPLRYQWILNEEAIAGATNPLFRLEHATTNDAGTYAVIVSNRGGSVTSSNATLTVTVPPPPTAPVITRQPRSQTVPAGTNVVLSVVASGTRPLSYQWRFNGTNLASGRGATLYLWSVRPEQAGEYSVVVGNTVGTVTSDPATLTVVAAPKIVLPPQSQMARPGSNVTFTVVASGSRPLSYQWKFNGQALAGATSPSLTLRQVSTNNNGAYAVVVSNAYGSVESRLAKLVVWSPVVVPPTAPTSRTTSTAPVPATANLAPPVTTPATPATPARGTATR